MWGVVVRLFTPVLEWIGGKIVNNLVADLIALISQWIREWRNKRIKKENLKKDSEAVNKGDLNEIAKSGEDILNGGGS